MKMGRKATTSRADSGALAMKTADASDWSADTLRLGHSRLSVVARVKERERERVHLAGGFRRFVVSAAIIVGGAWLLSRTSVMPCRTGLALYGTPKNACPPHTSARRI